MFFVYILECADGSFYVGHTNNLSHRMKAHNDGTAASFTHQRRPVNLRYSEHLPTRQLAVRRERQIKGWTHAKKIALIRGDLQALRQLSRNRSSARD